MKILIAGGAGYIGSALSEYLQSRNFDINVVDLLWFGNYLTKKIKVNKKNLFDISSKHLTGVDQLIFTAGISNDPMANYNPALNFIYNSALPVYLACEAKKAKVKRFIFASSCSVYQNTGNSAAKENQQIHPTYPYAVSKLIAEKGLISCADKDFSVIILRLGTVCGVSRRMRFDLALNTMFKTAITQKRIYISNPVTWRPIIDIGDVCQAFYRAAISPYSVNGIFNIAHSNYQTLKLAGIVKKKIELLSGKNVKLVINKNNEERNYKVSADKAKKILKFNPKIRIEETISNLYKYRLTVTDYDRDKYYNITVFKKIFKKPDYEEK